MSKDEIKKDDSKENTEKVPFLKRITDFSDWDKKTWLYVLIFGVIILITLYLAYRMTQDDTFLFNIIIHYVVIPISESKGIGIFIFIIFMAIQGIFAPIPSELVLLAAGMIWSYFTGFILGMVGSALAGWLCFYISRKGGRPIVEKAIGEKNIEIFDKLLDKYGFTFVFVMRAIPLMSFDPISYISGISKIETKKYMVATVLGSITRCIFWVWLGSKAIGVIDITTLNETQTDQFIANNAGTFNNYFYMILGIAAAAFLIYNFVLMPYLEKKSNSLSTNSKPAENNKQNMGEEN